MEADISVKPKKLNISRNYISNIIIMPNMTEHITIIMTVYSYYRQLH